MIGPYQVLPLRAGVDRGAMPIKWYSILPKTQAFTGASPSDYFVSNPGRSLGVVLHLSRDPFVVFCSLSQQGQIQTNHQIPPRRLDVIRTKKNCHLLDFSVRPSQRLNIKESKKIAKSSLCHGASTDIPAPLSPLFPIIHRF